MTDGSHPRPALNEGYRTNAGPRLLYSQQVADRPRLVVGANGLESTKRVEFVFAGFTLVVGAIPLQPL